MELGGMFQVRPRAAKLSRALLARSGRCCTDGLFQAPGESRALAGGLSRFFGLTVADNALLVMPAPRDSHGRFHSPEAFCFTMRWLQAGRFLWVARAYEGPKTHSPAH